MNRFLRSRGGRRIPSPTGSDPGGRPRVQTAQQKEEATRRQGQNQAMNRFIRQGRAGASDEGGASEEGGPLLIDLFAGLELTAAQQARCLRLVSGTGKVKGKAVPAMTARQAIAVVKPTFPRGDAGTGHGQGAQKPKPTMNDWLRQSAALSGMSSSEVNLLRLQGRL